MARGFAYAYKKGQRPAGEPAVNYKTLTPESHAVGQGRKIERAKTVIVHDPPVAAPAVKAPKAVSKTKKS